MVEKLTPEEEVVAQKKIDEALKYFFELNLPKIENTRKFIRFIYKHGGLKLPKVVRFRSPLECQMAATILQRRDFHSSDKISIRELEKEVISNLEKKQTPDYYSWGYYGDSSDLGWVAYFKYCEELGKIKNDVFHEYSQIIKDAPFLSLQFDEACITCEHPLYIKRDKNDKLHSMEGPAVLFKDGQKYHFIHGITFTEEQYIKMTDHKLTLEEIMKIDNAEQRTAVLAENLEVLIKSATLIDSTEWMQKPGYPLRLYKTEINSVTIKLLSMYDHTPVNKDDPSSAKQYIIRVEDNINKADEALVWSFNTTVAEYHPAVQT